jgi:hypothetical protein
LNNAFPDVTLLEFDVERSREALERAGYQGQFVPFFAVPGDDGRSSGRFHEGAVKGDQAVGFLVPKLRALLDGR